MAPLMLAHRWQMLAILAIIPVSAGMAMLVPYLTKVAIDDHIMPAIGQGPDVDLGPLTVLVGVALIVVIVGYIADGLYVSVLQRVGQNAIADLRDKVYRRTVRLPRKFFDNNPIGAVLTRVTSDIDALGEGLASGVLGLFMDSLKTLSYLSMMFMLDWRLTLVLLTIGPPLAMLMVFFQRRVRQAFFISRQNLAAATGYLQEVLNGMKTVQLYAAEAKVIDNFRKKNFAYYQAQNTTNFYDALLFSLIEGITTLALALLLWYASGSLLSGILTLGVLVAFIEYSQRLFIPVREFAQQMAVLQRAMAALEHIDELFQYPIDPALAAATPAKPSSTLERFESLVFDNVSFRYRDDDPLILKQLSFRVERGDRVAIVGPSGSGKSTIIRLLTRAYSGYDGSILINDQELDAIPLDRLTQMATIVHQSVFLFQENLKFNIDLDRTTVDENAVRAAVRYVNGEPMLEQLPAGLETAIASGGTNLSSGQAQLIALARAVAERAELIILDEATSAIDSMTEALVQQTLGRLYEHNTVIAIAHRLSTIRAADVILVVDGGTLVERGSHEQLLKKQGIYANFIRSIDH